ncbi:putative HTH-type transcriptional regulator [Carnimonas sp. R-84981]|uniref:XRE family transcriptional regulator n=1 Tax=Carnimonas bestiolae TaxID=3402172 RepID=UPI003EDC5622
MTYKETDEPKGDSDRHPFPLEKIGCFKNRLKSAIGTQSLRGFSRRCGLSEATLRSYLSGGTYPTLDRLLQMASALEKDPTWLAFGVSQKTNEEDDADDLPGSYAFIPLYDARVSAGSGAWNEHSKVLTNISFTRYSLRRQGLTPDNLSAIRIAGDSMEPVLHDGDTVVVDHTRAVIEGEGIYVLLLDGHLYAKRLQRTWDGIVVISENKAYREIVIPRDQADTLKVVGKAVWAAGWL